MPDDDTPAYFTFEPPPTTRATLAALGIPPHTVERMLREAAEDSATTRELYGYVTQIMDAPPERLCWIAARLLAAALRLPNSVAAKVIANPAPLFHCILVAANATPEQFAAFQPLDD